MNTYRKIFYSSAVALPMLALAATGVHAASTGNMGMFKFAPAKNVMFKNMEFKNVELTAEQKAAVEQAKALYAQADAILEKAGLPGRHPMMTQGVKLELTTEQKAIMEQVRKLHEEGKLDEAKALLETAGLPAGPHGVMKFRRMDNAGQVFFRAAPAVEVEVE